MDTSPKSIARPVPEPWKAALEQWQLWLSAGNRSPATIRTRLQHVRALSRDFPGGPESVTDDSLLAWVGNRQWAAETRHSHYMSFGQFFDWYSSKYGFISPGRVLPAIHRLAAPARPVPENTLLEAFGRASDRVQLILLLAAEAGLRSGEIACVHEDDLTKDLIGYSLLVHGKGGRRRIVPLGADLARRILSRLRECGPWLFPGNIDGHLSARWIGKLGASVLPSPWTLHTLRHRFATRAYNAEKDILAVKELLGHSNVATTQRYIGSDSGALRRAAIATRIAC